MNKLIELIEKGKPFFERISRNKYLRAIRDGFISAMPIVLFSSIFAQFLLFIMIKIYQKENFVNVYINKSIMQDNLLFF